MNDPFDSLRIRRGEPDDFRRVRKDWRLSYATSELAHFLTPRSDWRKRASELYWGWQTEVVDRLLRDADLWIATWAEDTSTIVGWCVTEGGLVHYVYVAEKFRKQGVARRLLAPSLERAKVTYTHRTALCSELPIPPNWTFDPRPALAPRAKEAA